MHDAAGIVLAGGRSSRMGTDKASLEWHGSTLLRRVTGLVARGVDGPVIVVRAPGQRLPPLPAEIEVVEDAAEGRGPLQGLAGGLAAIGGRATVAYLSATDVPLLHPSFVVRVIAALGADDDVVLPEIGGHRQPLAAVYRTSLLGVVQELVDAGRLKPGLLFDRCRVRVMAEAALLSDAALARSDPGLSSAENLNAPDDYRRARALPAPKIVVRGPETRAPDAGAYPPTVRAWTLGAALRASGVTLDEPITVRLNGELTGADPERPLVAGDELALEHDPGERLSARQGAAGTTTSGEPASGSAARSNDGVDSRSTRRGAVDERVHRIQEIDALGPVVHRDDHRGVERGGGLSGLRRADRGVAADRHEQQVDGAERRQLLVPAARAGRDRPRWAIRRPPKLNTNMMLAPRSVPAASSCSEATPTTSPTGES